MAMDELAVDAAAAGLIGFLSAIPPGSTIVSY
jgi:hypothetical protein